MIKTKNSKDYTLIVRTVYDLIKGELGFTARITNIWHLIKIAFGLQEDFAILDYESIHNSDLQSYLIDEQIKWQNGEEVDFTEMSNVILKAGNFTKLEKRMFVEEKLEERLWAIMLAVSNTKIEEEPIKN